jgi:hypothetical protein
MKILLITSTIAPAVDTFALKVTDSRSRLDDYKRAFLFYCQNLKKKAFDRIAYVDNSGHSLDELKEIALKEGVDSQIEFISYQSTIDPKNSSRFYLEINLIDYFYKNSELLKNHPEAIVWKVTGRYLIKNISTIISASNDNRYDLYINCRNHPYKVVDFYLVGMSMTAYSTIFSSNLNLYKGTTDGEIILREYIDQIDTNLLRVLTRFPVVPRILGTRGFDGNKYGGAKDLAKYYFRSILNVLVPSIWL